MPSEAGEIRYDRADMPEDCKEIARLLDQHGVAAFQYAAFGTLHCFIAMDSRMLLGAPDLALDLAPQAELWIGPYPPSGIGRPGNNSHTLWIRQNSNEGKSAWLNRGGYHEPVYVAGKFIDRVNATDALGLGVLFLLIERARIERAPGGELDPRYDPATVVPHWMDVLEGDRELPAFLGGENER